MWNGYSFLNVFYILALLCFKNSAFNLPMNRVSCLNTKLHLQMGCDYFVSKSLRIYYTNEPFYSVIEFSKECCKYNDDGRIPGFLLTRPLIIYTNNSYILDSFENKYGKLIEERIQNDTQTLDNVTKIIKTELLLEK
jgi:hypothetical protein